MDVNTEIKPTNLFLDDIREPEDAYYYTNRRMYINWHWHTVRNYDEFVNWITINGMPSHISFDHDLADTHYDPNHVGEHMEKTGYDCAKWLVEYCLDNNIKCPEFDCHSMNPVGKINILNLLVSLRDYQENLD